MLHNNTSLLSSYKLLDEHAKVVRKAEEMYWKQLKFSCMSEEDSTTEDENNKRHIVCHSLSWRLAGNNIVC